MRIQGKICIISRKLNKIIPCFDLVLKTHQNHLLEDDTDFFQNSPVKGELNSFFLVISHCQSFSRYKLLCAIFITCSWIIIVPH
jgi:hypothetical protein